MIANVARNCICLHHSTRGHAKASTRVSEKVSAFRVHPRVIARKWERISTRTRISKQVFEVVSHSVNERHIYVNA